MAKAEGDTIRATRALEVAADQRERLIDAAIGLSRHRGFSELSIADLTDGAGVSRASFYELFADKRECLVAAYDDVAQDAVERMRRGVDRGVDRGELPALVLAELLAFIDENPDAGWMLASEGLSGVDEIGAARHRLALVTGQLVEALLDAKQVALTLDIPALGLIGGVRAVLANALSHGRAADLPTTVRDLVLWVRAYAAPAARARYSVSDQATNAVPVDLSDEFGMRLTSLLVASPDPLPRGNHGLHPSLVARNHRRRLLSATANVVRQRGYERATVAQIVATARVARDVFYQHFTGKEAAFLEAQAEISRLTTVACAGVYFGANSWPERVYKTIALLCANIAAEPSLAHLALIESSGAGAAAKKQLEDSLRGAAMFLREGYSQSEQAEALPAVCSEAIIGAIYELICEHISYGTVGELPRRAPQLTHVVIAPFLGPGTAAREITRLQGQVRT
jgi:AcrR family transcriptional regulator